MISSSPQSNNHTIIKYIVFSLVFILLSNKYIRKNSIILVKFVNVRFMYIYFSIYIQIQSSDGAEMKYIFTESLFKFQ